MADATRVGVIGCGNISGIYLTNCRRLSGLELVACADLDLLRNINNTYGHLAGDEVLKGVADILKHSVREYDVVARFGG